MGGGKLVSEVLRGVGRGALYLPCPKHVLCAGLGWESRPSPKSHRPPASSPPNPTPAFEVLSQLLVSIEGPRSPARQDAGMQGNSLPTPPPEELGGPRSLRGQRPAPWQQQGRRNVDGVGFKAVYYMLRISQQKLAEGPQPLSTFTY